MAKNISLFSKVSIGFLIFSLVFLFDCRPQKTSFNNMEPPPPSLELMNSNVVGENRVTADGKILEKPTQQIEELQHLLGLSKLMSPGSNHPTSPPAATDNTVNPDDEKIPPKNQINFPQVETTTSR